MEPSHARQAQPQSDRGDPSLTLDAVIAAVITAFVAAIAGAFIYGKHSDKMQQAAAPLPPPAIYHKVETTGSGG